VYTSIAFRTFRVYFNTKKRAIKKLWKISKSGIPDFLFEKRLEFLELKNGKKETSFEICQSSF